FVRRQLQSWFEAQFQVRELPALEVSRLNLTSPGRVAGAAPPGDTLEISADAMAAALGASAHALANPQAKVFTQKSGPLQLLGLIRTNQLLAAGGFSLVNGDPFPALTRSFGTAGSARPMNIESSLNWPGLFAMPSSFRVKRGFQLPDQTAAAN